MEISFFYITAKNIAEAQSIGRKLVEERMAACVNIISPLLSIYRWEGKICEENEVALIVKTIKTSAGALIQRIKELHSYTCPCIVELPVLSGNPDYLQWIATESTTQPSEPIPVSKKSEAFFLKQAIVHPIK
jgi:periplasmic divalent cation tolerance protein